MAETPRPTRLLAPRQPALSPTRSDFPSHVKTLDTMPVSSYNTGMTTNTDPIDPDTAARYPEWAAAQRAEVEAMGAVVHKTYNGVIMLCGTPGRLAAAQYHPSAPACAVCVAEARRHSLKLAGVTDSLIASTDIMLAKAGVR